MSSEQLWVWPKHRNSRVVLVVLEPESPCYQLAHVLRVSPLASVSSLFLATDVPAWAGAPHLLRNELLVSEAETARNESAPPSVDEGTEEGRRQGGNGRLWDSTSGEPQNG